jgi:hypothetical protein
MEEAILDEELQRRIQITSLMQHGGYKIFIGKVRELQDCFANEVLQILSSEVNDEKLALLNMRLGKTKALSAVMAIHDELLEEITPSEGDTSEEVIEG